MIADFNQLIIRHYAEFWGGRWTAHRWPHDPHPSLPALKPEFCVLEFPETETENWRYATCGMSAGEDGVKLELFLYAPGQRMELVELLTVVAHYHLTGSRVGLHHTVNFGRPWIAGSRCDFGFISLPYLEDPGLETLDIAEETVKFLWLVPITKEEVEYKKKAGVESLEARFEERELNYIDPLRGSVA